MFTDEISGTGMRERSKFIFIKYIPTTTYTFVCLTNVIA